MTALKKCLLLKSLHFFSICLCLQGALNAAPSKLESNSPFLPPGYGELKPVLPKTVQKANSPLAGELEFRGVVQLDGVYQFSLFKKSENQSYWISEGESENGITVNDFSADSMLITVTLNGRSEQLGLVTASENPLPVVANSPSVQSQLPPELPPNILSPANTRNDQPQRRTIPRRRVILPSKNK